MLQHILYDEISERIRRQRKQGSGVIHILEDSDLPFIGEFMGASFSTVLRASLANWEKVAFHRNVGEIAWRHNHDRLLIDFFVCEAFSGRSSGSSTSQKMGLLWNRPHGDPSTRPS